MLKFSAETFYVISQRLAILREAVKKRQMPLPQDGCDYMLPIIRAIAVMCDTVSLSSSRRAAERLADALNPEMAFQVIEDRVSELSATIHAEMQEHLFLWVPAHRAKYYQPKVPHMGADFATRFRRAERDTDKAGECFALGQFTASVFHLMRVMEICLHAVDNSLQLPAAPDRNWGSILQRWRKNEIAKHPASEVTWKAHEAFYKDTSATLASVKDAWRNATMHVERDYDESEAGAIFTAVQSFARNLASVIDEDGAFI